MSNLLDRFKKNVIGSQNTIYDYITTISSTGDFKRISHMNVILNSWNNILLTPRGTYINDPDFGSNIYKYVFEPADNVTIENIKREIRNDIILYDNRALINDIKVVFQNNGKIMNISITATYKGEKGILDIQFDDTTYADFLTRSTG